jgi:hypothetical protein
MTNRAHLVKIVSSISPGKNEFNRAMTVFKKWYRAAMYGISFNNFQADKAPC